MDNFYTILLYIGALLLIGLFKSISKAGKKKPVAAISHTFLPVEEEKEEHSFDYDSIFDFLQENSILTKNEVKSQKNKKPPSPLPVQNEQDRAIKKALEAPVIVAEKEPSFVFGNFDLPAAIVYSEILKRPDY
ncbi:MAG: hypothetical protein FWF09_01155 [Bacteroidales bacterium]|nr:hypothetical protein [Bacteroidales bacterium]